MTINQAISAKILIKVASGMDIKSALDSVCGVGSYDGLVSDLYEELRG